MPRVSLKLKKVPHQEALHTTIFHAKQEKLALKCFFFNIYPPNPIETQSHARLSDTPT
jgi:hypothetical protein